MRICVISGTFHPEPGGPPTYLYHLLPALNERGHSVVVVTYGEASEANSSSYPYSVLRISRRTSIPQRLLAFSQEVLRQGRTTDVLFVSDYGLPAAVANLWLRKPMVLKIVSDFAWEFASRHGWTKASVEAFQTERPSPCIWLLKAVRQWYSRRARIVIVPSRHVGRLAEGWGIHKPAIRAIYNALPPERTNMPTREETRKAFGWPAEIPMLVTVGRLAEVKRIDLQLEMLRSLPEAHLVIVGDGPDRESLQRQSVEAGLADRVTFTGGLPHEQTMLAIRAADLFVLSSRTEGLSHVLLEAMQLGTPCIASEVGGNPEVITHQVDGLLVPFADVNALVSAVRSLLDDPPLRARLAEAAQKNLARFGWDRLVNETESVLKEAAHE